MNKKYVKQTAIKWAIVVILTIVIVRGKYDYYRINNKFVSSKDKAIHIDSTKKTYSVNNSNNIMKLSSKSITEVGASEIVEKCVKNKNSKTKFIFDHQQCRAGVEYYVIHGFDSMEDHVATSGWYFVNKSNGKVYEWDLESDALIQLN